MTAYAVAHLRTLSDHDDVLTYIERIQETMEPYGGRFLVHGTAVEVVEGEWPGSRGPAGVVIPRRPAGC